MITQGEIAERYGVPKCDISFACSTAGIRPIGRKGRILYWDQEEVANALYAMYRKREANMSAKAAAWGDKARSVLDTFQKTRG